MSSVSFPPMGCRSITLTGFNHAGSLVPLCRPSLCPGAYAPVSESPHPWRGHLQPSTRLLAICRPIVRGVEARHGRLRHSRQPVIELPQTKGVPHYGRLVRCGTPVAAPVLESSPKSSPLSPGVNRANGDLIRARHLQSRGKDTVRSELGSSIS